MYTGVQFTGTLGPNGSNKWFTFGWNAASHVVWYMMPTTIAAGAPELDWSVAVERYNATQCTYWLTVTNRTAATITFEGRYAVLS
jgi:hypothetical protein